MKARESACGAGVPFVFCLQSCYSLFFKLAIKSSHSNRYADYRRQRDWKDASRHSVCSLCVLLILEFGVYDESTPAGKKFSPLPPPAHARRSTGRRAMPSTITQNLTPSASNSGTTCRRVQMSKWRQKGFVQDSDEEEDESQLESQGSRQNGGLSGRVERVEEGVDAIGRHEKATEKEQATVYEDREKNCAAQGSEGVDKEETVITTPTKRSPPRRPTPSPFTPRSTHSFRRELTESPDPLLGSQTPKIRRNVPPPSSLRLASPILQPSSAVSIPQLDDNHAVPVSDNSTVPIQSTMVGDARSPKHVPTLFHEFGILPYPTIPMMIPQISQIHQRIWSRPRWHSLRLIVARRFK